MKYAEEIFPKSTFPDQKSDGAYLNNLLSSNLDILGRRVVDDLHFLGVISGNDSVGNGKTTMATHVGSYLTWKINKLHNLNLTFTSKNMVFNTSDLEKRSFDLPKYSVIVLDESDDLMQHWSKESTLNIKKFFNKCRQHNKILIIITPSFFNLPKFYALARSHFLINVKFHNDFRRGVFDFYGASKKKTLYIRGKKEWDYGVIKPDFSGAFSSSYVFFPKVKGEIEIYRRLKYLDMIDNEKGEKKLNEKEIKAQLFYDVYNNLGDVSIKRLSEAFKCSVRTATRWLAYIRKEVPSINEGENEPDVIRQ